MLTRKYCYSVRDQCRDYNCACGSFDGHEFGCACGDWFDTPELLLRHQVDCPDGYREFCVKTGLLDRPDMGSR